MLSSPQGLRLRSGRRLETEQAPESQEEGSTTMESSQRDAGAREERHRATSSRCSSAADRIWAASLRASRASTPAGVNCTSEQGELENGPRGGRGGGEEYTRSTGTVPRSSLVPQAHHRLQPPRRHDGEAPAGASREVADRAVAASLLPNREAERRHGARAGTQKPEPLDRGSTTQRRNPMPQEVHCLDTSTANWKDQSRQADQAGTHRTTQRRHQEEDAYSARHETRWTGQRRPAYRVSPTEREDGPAPYGYLGDRFEGMPYWEGQRIEPVAPENENKFKTLPVCENERKPGGETSVRGFKARAPTPAPETRDLANEAMLRAIAELVEHTRSLRTDRARPPKELVFEGKDHEDPEVFLEELEEFFKSEDIPHRRYVVIAKSCLRGEAKQWADHVAGAAVSWELFVSRFLETYNSVTFLSALTRRLYGDEQKDSSKTFSFIAGKAALFQRVSPDTSEEAQVAVIKDQLHPEISIHLRGHKLDSIHQLIALATQVEKDVLRGTQASTRKETKQPLSDALGTKPKQSQQAEQPAPKSQWQQRAQAPSTPSPRDTGAQQANQRGNWRDNNHNKKWNNTPAARLDAQERREPPPTQPAPTAAPRERQGTDDWRRREAERMAVPSTSNSQGNQQATQNQGNASRGGAQGNPRPQNQG